MSKHGTRPGALRISGSGLPGGTAVELDGVDISNTIDGLSLRLGVREAPTVTLGVLVWDASVEMDGSKIVVPEETRDLLVRLGWTPPAEEAQS